MVEVDPTSAVVGAAGGVPLIAIGTLVERTTGGVRSREHGLQSVDQTRQLTLSPSADFPFATWQFSSEPAC